MFLDDLKTRCLTLSGIVFGTNLFVSMQATIPKSDTGTIQIVETSGTGSEHTHNRTTGPTFVHPTAQILVRATTWTAARTLAERVFGVMTVRNATINSKWYRELEPLQPPFDAGTEADGQARVIFNVIATKVP